MFGDWAKQESDEALARKRQMGEVVFGGWAEFGAHTLRESDGALALRGFARNSVTVTGTQALLSLVRAFGRAVKGLDFTRMFVDGPAAVAAVGEALRTGACPALRELDIQHNEAGVGDVAALGDALRVGACPELRFMDIQHNFSIQNVPHEAKRRALRRFGDALRVSACPELRKLNVCQDSYQDEANLGDLSAACPQLTSTRVDCISGGTPVRMGGGGQKAAHLLRAGDVVYSPALGAATVIVATLRGGSTAGADSVPMVSLPGGGWITAEHPIRSSAAGQWTKPTALAAVQLRPSAISCCETCLCNFVLAGGHSIEAGGVEVWWRWATTVSSASARLTNCITISMGWRRGC